jgi:hypothetical protein
MPRRDPAKAFQMLDSLAEFFDDGRRWIKNNFHDDDGNRCLISAMHHLRAVMKLQGDGTGYYLIEAQDAEPRRRAVPIISFNDGCESYDEIRVLIDRARTIAQAERDEGPKHRVVNKTPAPRQIRQRPVEPSDHPQGMLLFAKYGWKAKQEALLKLKQSQDQIEEATTGGQARLQLLAEIERERAIRAAASDTRPTWISLPRIPIPQKIAA